MTTKILDWFRRKEKTSAIFFDIDKAYDKVNRGKTFEQLENMETQERMLEFIRELISENRLRWEWEDLFYRTSTQAWELHKDGCSQYPVLGDGTTQ